MTRPSIQRHVFRPTMTGARLEERQVLSGGTIPATPVPAPSPVSAASIRLEAAQIRTAYLRQFKAAATDLKSAVKTDISQLYAGGTTPTAQQLTDFSAEVAGAVNATALRMSSQAALLPAADARLVPAIQNSLLGSRTSSLVSRLTALAASSHDTASASTLQSAITSQINRASSQNLAQVSNFFNTTSLNRLAVSSTGGRKPLEELHIEVYMGEQLVSQVANTFGSLAASFPSVANSVLYNGSATPTPTPTQQLFDQFGVQARNALSTAAYQLGSDLAVFPGSSTVISQIQPALFGAATSSSSSLADALQTLPYGSTNFDTAVTTAFNTAFQSVVSPISSFLKMATDGSLSLPTSGFTSPFVSGYDTGFNNGFATGSSTGFIGFGVAPATFNTNYGTGFGSVVTNLVTTSGLLGTQGTQGGVPVQSR